MIYCSNCDRRAEEPRVVHDKNGEEYGVCPYCGNDLYEVLETCHVCGVHYEYTDDIDIIYADSPETGQPERLAICGECRDKILSDIKWQKMLIAEAAGLTLEALEELEHEQQA